MTRTTPDFTSVACATSGMSLFSALCMLSWVLPQALNEIDGVLLGDRLDAILHRRGVVAQHVQAGTEGDDLDLHFLAEVLVVLLDVGGVVERQIHHRRLVGVHLQDEVMRLLGAMPCAGGIAAGSVALRRRRRGCEEQRPGPHDSAAANRITCPNFVIMLSCCWIVVQRSSVARRAGAAGHLQGTGQPGQHDFQAGEGVSPLQRRALPVGDAKGDLAVVGQRRQQAYDIAPEATPVPDAAVPTATTTGWLSLTA